MREQLIRILNVLRGYDPELTIETFENRLKNQKIIFIATQAGFESGLAYNWYIRGPYSPTLSAMLYEARDQGLLDFKSRSLPYKRSEFLIGKQIRELVGQTGNEAMELELLASVWYLMPLVNNQYLSPGDVKLIIEYVSKTLRNLKPYSENEIERAVKKILDFMHK